jgi:PIN domain nuclease of toxin-antitoxin system
VRILLDTHVFLWLNTEPERLGRSLAITRDPENELMLSAASSWEIAIKYGLGKLPLPEPPLQWVANKMMEISADGIAVEHSHALTVSSLPQLHRDPFDRLLVAQARLLNLTLLTADPAVAQYAAVEPNRDDFIVVINAESRSTDDHHDGH